MLAVYYSDNAGHGPCNMCSLELEEDSVENLLSKIEELDLPFPDSEILFIENDKIINRINLR